MPLSKPRGLNLHVYDQSPVVHCACGVVDRLGLYTTAPPMASNTAHKKVKTRREFGDHCGMNIGLNVSQTGIHRVEIFFFFFFT